MMAPLLFGSKPRRNRSMVVKICTFLDMRMSLIRRIMCISRCGDVCVALLGAIVIHASLKP